jgi:hypothetical protein
MRRQSMVGRRRWSAGLATGAAALLLAACGGPDVDRDLVNEWDGFAEPGGFVPDAGRCHADPYQPVAALVDYRPVDCARSHLVETVHVGTFTGDVAEADTPPAPDSGPVRAAYRECEERAADHLGADFRFGPLWLGVAVPSEEGWGGGARWFRCDLTELESVVGEPVVREGSLSAALEEDSPLRLRCSQVGVEEDGTVAEQTPVPCDEPHDAEFVGVWRAPDGPYPDPDADTDAVYGGCRSLIADFTGVPDDGDVRFRVGAIVDWMSEPDWDAGDRGFRCRLWMADEELTESLEGAGPEALPVRTE